MNEPPAGPGRAEIGRLVSSLPDGAVRIAGDEVAFDAAWEIRAFALAVAAHERGTYGWPEFQRALVASIAKDNGWKDDGSERPWSYYDHWVEALEALLEEAGLVSAMELDNRTRVVLDTPRDLEHQRARREPVSVDRGTDGARSGPGGAQTDG